MLDQSHTNMATDSNKENIADGLLPAAPKMASLSPRKPKKSRSLSMGPGARASAPLKEDAGNRRKVCIVSQCHL